MIIRKCLDCGQEFEVKSLENKKIYCSSYCKVRYWKRNHQKPINNDIMSIIKPNGAVDNKKT